MYSNMFVRHKSILLYGVSLAIVLYLLQWLKVRLLILDHAFEIYVGIIAIIFTTLGIWLGLKLTKPKIETVVIKEQVFTERPSDMKIKEAAFRDYNLTGRELEVLQLMSRGLSNQEIAQQLFLSLSTIKTHSNNLFDKLAVKRRTQAVDKGRQLGIIP